MLAKKKYLARWGSGKQDEYKRWEEQRDANNSAVGAGASTVIEANKNSGVNYNVYPLSFSSGVKTTVTKKQSGNSSRPISMYSKTVANNPSASSVGLALNNGNFSQKYFFSLASIGQSISYNVDGKLISLSSAFNWNGSVSITSSVTVDVGNDTTQMVYHTSTFDLKSLFIFALSPGSVFSGADSGAPVPVSP